MTGFKLERFPFDADALSTWGMSDPRHRNWPVVYIMSNNREVYVGESLNAEARMRQHLSSDEKKRLRTVRVILDEKFNKSACLDLESYLIRMFAGDGELQVLNHNAGITEAEYYNRDLYKTTFDEIFEQLRTEERLFRRTIPEIINSDLFKLSPFKALNHDQAIALEDILDGIFDDITNQEASTVVVQGNPGTGKTVVAIYLLKLLEDIRRHNPEEPPDIDSIFSDFFTPGHAELLKPLRVGLVVPQQSLRESISKIFSKTPSLSRDLVLTPFQVGESAQKFDLLVVDEAHRLNQRANQASGPLNKKFSEINKRLFGSDETHWTQLDWIKAQSEHAIFMLDADQSVRPADLPAATTSALTAEATANGRHYALRSQMRVAAGQDFIKYVREVLSDNPPPAQLFPGYDLRFFTDLGQMRRAIWARDQEHGLSRLVAGYAWPWQSKKDKFAFDIEIDGEQLRWNSTLRDWISAPTSVDEVGSIHTVQGYDLNFAGVIIGKDLRYDPARQRLYFDRAEYHDKKGRENNPKLGITYSDDDLLGYVKNIYTVLLTRGILGTYLYICDASLREHLRAYF